ncbi:hypothetical protein L7F22_009959, partial [Adiantum nelumboides]|nr:hypothetical protein [Adiantum nelumboides]
MLMLRVGKAVLQSAKLLFSRGRPKLHADVGFDCHATNRASEQGVATRKAETSHSF